MEKTNSKALFVSFLLDETGSMQSIKNDTVGGFNAYLEELQKGDVETVFSLVSFNSSETKKRYVAELVERVQPLTLEDYHPQAMTPLIDASVKIIKATEEAVEKRSDEVDVAIVIQTDGQENVSVEYTNADLALLVKEKQAAGWQFVFLGAGLDAFEAAQAAGLDLPVERILAYARGKSKQTFDVMAAKMSRYRATRSMGDLDFVEEERARVADEPEEKKGGRGDRRASIVNDIDL